MAHCSINHTLCLPGNLTLLWNRQNSFQVHRPHSPQNVLAQRSLPIFLNLPWVSLLWWGYVLIFVLQDANIFWPGHPPSPLEHVSFNTHTAHYNFHGSCLCEFCSDINTQLFWWPRYKALFTSAWLIRTSSFQKTIWLKLKRFSPKQNLGSLSCLLSPGEGQNPLLPRAEARSICHWHWTPGFGSQTRVGIKQQLRINEKMWGPGAWGYGFFYIYLRLQDRD